MIISFYIHIPPINSFQFICRLSESKSNQLKLRAWHGRKAELGGEGRDPGVHQVTPGQEVPLRVPGSLSTSSRGRTGLPDEDQQELPHPRGDRGVLSKDQKDGVNRENINISDQGTLWEYKLLHHSDSDKLVEDFIELKSFNLKVNFHFYFLTKQKLKSFNEQKIENYKTLCLVFNFVYSLVQRN